MYIAPPNFKNGSAKGNNALFINGRIRDKLNIYQTRYLKFGSLADRLTVNELKERITEESQEYEIDFIRFVKDYKANLKEGDKLGSLRAVRGFLGNLEDFSPSLKFSEIDLAFLNSFQSYLIKKGIGNAVNNYMRYFRLIFNRGRDKFNDEDRGIIRIPHYPFRKFKILKKKTKLKITIYR